MTSHSTSPRAVGDSVGFTRLDEDACWSILERNRVGRVAVIHRSRPVVFPVNFAVDAQAVVFRSGFGTKLTAAMLGRPATFEVDEFDESFRRGVSVMLHGWLHEITDPAELARAGDLGLRPWADGARDHFLRVHSGRVTGRGIGIGEPGDYPPF